MKELAIFCRWVASLTFALPALCCGAAANAEGKSASGTAGAPLMVGEAVAGVLGYARWPVVPAPLRVCVLGSSVHASMLSVYLLATFAGRDFELRVLDESAAVLAGCSALYVGTYSAAAWRQLTPQLTGLPLLTLCERSDACSNAGMFSLDIDSAGTTRFEVNLDAVARGRVRVHPQVLRLGQHEGPR